MHGLLKDVGEDMAPAEEALGECDGFVQWLVRLLLASLYPGAAYQRKHVAVDLLQVSTRMTHGACTCT